MGRRLSSQRGKFELCGSLILRIDLVKIARTSGTEPKVRFSMYGRSTWTDFVLQIKYYLEGSGKDSGIVRQLLPKVVTELRDVWMEADKNALGMP